KIYLEPVAITVPAAFAHIDQSASAIANRTRIGSFRHQHHFKAWNRAFDQSQKHFDLAKIRFRGHDELQLEIIPIDPFSDHLWLQSSFLVTLLPFVAVFIWRRVSELRAERRQIARNFGWRDCRSSLDCNVFSSLS